LIHQRESELEKEKAMSDENKRKYEVWNSDFFLLLFPNIKKKLEDIFIMSMSVH
jgi:hypothetical protein